MFKSLEEMKKDLEQREYPVITKPEIEEYNAQPEVKERGAKLVTISSDRFKNILLIILLGFLICSSTFAYLAYNDKLKLLNIDIPACPIPAEIPSCPTPAAIPACPACPAVNVACSNITLSCPNLNNTILYLRNSS